MELEKRNEAETVDAIPLTTMTSEDNISAIENYYNSSTESVNGHRNKTEGDDAAQVDGQRKRITTQRSFRVNSTYISQKNRLSRYTTAVKSILPFRSDQTSHELPVDNVGCCSNFSYFWVRNFLLNEDDNPMVEPVENRKKYNFDFVPPFNDRADVNGKRLLGIYKDEKQTRGRHGSMMKVAWIFCRTRVIIASIFYTLSTLSALCAPVIFLKMTLDDIEKENVARSELELTSANSTVTEMFKVLYPTFKFYARIDGALMMLAFAFCLLMSKVFATITSWLNLRTAIRLRTGVIAAAYRKSIKSSILNNIAPHQVLTDDVNYIMELVDHQTKIAGTIIAMILSLVASIILLNGPGVWPIIGSIGFFVVPLILARISANRLRKSMHYLARKISVIECFCTNFKDIVIHGMTYNYVKQFYDFNANHLSSVRTSKIFSVHIYDGVTAVLLGGLYLIWCDNDIETNSVKTLVLVLVYVFFIKNFVADYCHSVEAIANGKASLQKLKNSFTGLIAPELTRERTIDTRILISMQNCKFRSNENATFSIEIMKGQLIGVTGKNTKSLIYAILGHNECRDGIFRQRGSVGFSSEEPFICAGTIRDNIIMGGDFDAKRYYTAVTTTKLNEDVLQTLGSDDMSVELMDLSKQQKQRIALARALYCERDIYLFDEPFKNAVFASNVLQIFANVVQQIMNSDPNKSIIVSSSNQQILNICSNIYDTSENKMLTRSEYSRQSSVNYNEGSVHYTFENVRGCNQNGLSSYRTPSRFHVQIVNEHHQSQQSHNRPPNDDSTELLISKEVNESSWRVGFANTIVIRLLTFLNTTTYFLLVFGFITFVMRYEVKPWLEFVFFGGFLLSASIELVMKIYLASVLQMKEKKFHKNIFEKLLNTSLDYLCGTSISEILNWFSLTFYSQLEVHIKIVQPLIIISTALLFLLFINYWLTSCMLVILIVGQVFSFKIIFQGKIQSTLNFYSLVEYESKKRMFQLMTNNFRGRDVIQSYDRTSEFCKDFNFLVEDNSMAVFLMKSVKNHLSFMLQMLTFVNTTIMILLTLVIGEQTIYNYLFNIILYYLILYNINECVVDGYLEMMILQCRRQLIEDEVRNIQNNKQVSLLYDPPMKSDSGITLDFKEIDVKLCGRTVLSIDRLHIDKGQIIGITGNGAHLLTSVLFKLLKPNLGVIFIGTQDLSLINQDSLQNIMSVVPSDLQTQDMTIGEFLNPSKSISHKAILNKIQATLPYILQLPKKLNELMRNVSRRNKQILCLVKASLKPTTKIVILEYPDLDILHTINVFIRTELIEKTIIVIGTNHRQFETCSQIVNLDLESKKK